MSSVEERLNKLREERIAREKARIEKLRELNLKKYGKNDIQQAKPSSTPSVPTKPKSASSITNSSQIGIKKPSSIPNLKKLPPKVAGIERNGNITNKVQSKVITKVSNVRKDNLTSKLETKIPKVANNNPIVAKNDKPLKEITAEVTIKHMNGDKNVNSKLIKNRSVNNDFKSRKSLAVPRIENKIRNDRKSVQPNMNAKESVFDRLYKPKVVQKQTVDNALKLKTDPNYLKKVINESRLITKRHTIFESKPTKPVRRSISAIHFKRISKKELCNCFHKYASIGEKIDKVHLKDVHEDDCIAEERVVSAVKSERKKVKFLTNNQLNTPKPEEVQLRLQNWLQKRGKSIDTYHHLQCFGLHNVSRPLSLATPNKFESDDDENKENIAVEHDSDNESYLENMNNVGDLDGNEFCKDKWRSASIVSEVDFSESCETTLTSGEGMHHVDELLLGALSDLTELLREGYDWEQCARWLRAVRERFPDAPAAAPYWECRAALEERRGDLPASVHCWERAIAQGTEQSVVEANLDQLLDKFMQLKISPTLDSRPMDPKLVDARNVFKSRIIRFAVQEQAKLRQSCGTPKYTVTPVRRSSRLSAAATPTDRLRVCATIREASLLGAEFRPNKALLVSP